MFVDLHRSISTCYSRLFVSVAHRADRGDSGSAGEAATPGACGEQLQASCCEAQAQLGQVGEQGVVGSSAWLFSVGVAREAVNAAVTVAAGRTTSD